MLLELGAAVGSATKANVGGPLTRSTCFGCDQGKSGIAQIPDAVWMLITYSFVELKTVVGVGVCTLYSSLLNTGLRDQIFLIILKWQVCQRYIKRLLHSVHLLTVRKHALARRRGPPPTRGPHEPRKLGARATGTADRK